VNVSTRERLVRRLRDTGRVADRPRRGRPRVTTPRQDRTIHLAHLRNRHVTATETALTTVGNYNRYIHPKTVRNRLRELGLRARRPYIGFPLTRARRARRMAWLVAHGPKQFPMRQWRRFFSTDESRFTLFRPDVVWNASPTLAFLRGIGLGWLGNGLGKDISRVKVAVDCDSR
jgi:hypothetical protein